MLETLNSKIREFEQTCTEQYRAKIKALELKQASHPDLSDLRTQLQSSRLNEEMLRKQYEGQLALTEQTLQDYRQRLARADQLQDGDLRTQLDNKVRELKIMEERVRRLEAEEGEKGKFEEERKRRERMEEEYKRVAMELTEEKLRNKREIDGDMKLRLKELEFVNQKMKREHSNLLKVYKRAQQTIQALEGEKTKWEHTRRMKSPIRSATITPRNKSKSDDSTIAVAALERKRQHLTEEVQELEDKRNQMIQSIQTRDWEDLRRFYEKKCLDLSDEVLRWKEKTTSLVSKFYTALKKLKREGKNMRQEVNQTKSGMEQEVAAAVEEVRTKYEYVRVIQALTRAEKQVRASEVRVDRLKRDTSAGRKRPPKAESSFG